MSRKRKDQPQTIAKRKLRFFKHLRTYLAMSIFFVLLNIVGGSNHFWAIYPILGWGLGVGMEYLSLFGPLKDNDDSLQDALDYDPLDLDSFPSKTKESPPAPNQPSYREEDLI